MSSRKIQRFHLALFLDAVHKYRLVKCRDLYFGPNSIVHSHVFRMLKGFTVLLDLIIGRPQTVAWTQLSIRLWQPAVMS